MEWEETISKKDIEIFRSKFIYDVASAFLSGKKCVTWYPVYSGSLFYKWTHLAIKNLCAISNFKPDDFKTTFTSISLK